MNIFLFQYSTQDVLGTMFLLALLVLGIYALNKMIKRDQRLESGLNLDENGEPIVTHKVVKEDQASTPGFGK